MFERVWYVYLIIKSYGDLMKNLFLIPLLLLLSGCMGAMGTFGETMKYSGPGTFQDFAAARYECAKGSKGNSGGGTYQGFSSTQTVDCGMMDSCLASKGFIRNKNGNHDASSMRVACSN